MPEMKRPRGRPRKVPIDVGEVRRAREEVNGPAGPDYRAQMVDRGPEAGQAPPAGERVTIPIREGKAIWDESRNLDSLKAAIAAEPGAAGRLGLVQDKTEIVQDVVTPEHARALYAAVSDVLTFSISRQAGLPRKDLQQILGYSEKEYEAMCPLTARILNRYLPARLSAYQDLMLLGVTLYEVHQRKWLQLREYLEMRQRILAPAEGTGEQAAGTQ